MGGTVLLRRGALGDVVLLGAVTAAVPGPVTVLTRARYVPLAKRLIGVDQALPWPDGAPRALAGSLPDGAIIDLQGNLRSRILTALTRRGAGRIAKRSLARRWRVWSKRDGPARPTVPELYAEACGVAPRPPLWIDVGPTTRDYLALVPGAAWATKRYAPSRMIEVGLAWSGPVVVLGGPGEEEVCERVAAAIPAAEALVERGFDRTIEVLGQTRVAVAGDTGPMHLAGACGARVVALFGPTHPDDGFFVYPGEVVQRPLPCRPCTLHRQPACPLGHGRCMDHDAATVVAAVHRAAGMT